MEEQEILNFTNYDLDNIVTPVKIEIFKSLMQEANYNEDEIEFLEDSFRNGFSLGYEGSSKVQITAPNLKFTGVGNNIILWNKVMKEVKAGRYAGPYESIPFKHFIQSPIGLVPKDNGHDTRLIFHLSYPRGANSTSVNANTPPEYCKVKYPDFNRAVELCIFHGKGCVISRSDVKMAFS